MKKLLALVLSLAMVLSLTACGGQQTTSSEAQTTQAQTTQAPTQAPTTAPTEPAGSEPVTEPASTVPEGALVGNYTYKTYSTSLGKNWNPHSWETNAESSVLDYITTPFVNMQVKDSENGIYQWIYLAATEVNDVTASHTADLEKYAVTLPEGKTAAEVTEGYVYEIKLNPDMKWEDGTPISADDYVYSFKAMLDPEMKNYRANLYYDGESACAGAVAYYNAGTVVTNYGKLGMTVQEYLDNGGKVDDLYIDVYNFWGAQGYITAEGEETPQFVNALDETVYSADGAGDDKYSGAEMYAYFAPDGPYAGYAPDYVFTVTGQSDYTNATWDDVGMYKVDDYTIVYVNATYIDANYFLTSLTSNWLVDETLYEGGKETSGTLVTTNYCTSKDTTKSYGPYKMSSFQDEKQCVYVQNENWYGYEKVHDADGNEYLVSYTDYLVDGESVQRYMATSIVIDVMTDDAAKEAFLKGDLDDWAPPADQVVDYATSEQLYKVDETYMMSFFFNTNLDNLKEMDASKGNTNSVVLSNETFRRAFSLSIDRAEWVTATAGYKPYYSLLNELYYYDVYNDPESIYRHSDQAMQAICNLYDVKYGEGTPYKDLKEAYDSITGYNLTEAQELMKQAYKELTEAGVYSGGDIHIRVGYKKGALDSTDNTQVELIQKYLNAALEGSGFGKAELEAVGNIEDRYKAVPNGEFAIGYGAWGGAAFYPFRNMQVYCDTEQYAGQINEAADWDPATETLTLTLNGEEVTMTWQDWSRSCVGTGRFSTADFETKLNILSAMEEQFLKKYYRIPLAGSTACSMLSYKLNYYTENYNIMYGFGGLELMRFNYTDEEWAAAVKEAGGVLEY
ncbi:MAG: hypothetical protein IJL47_08200 [Lachnospiraceae bacterium]|nr:hypothetical protein [Lachnospiraceae bacterium]